MTLSTVNQSYINGNGANEKEFLRLTKKFLHQRIEFITSSIITAMRMHWTLLREKASVAIAVAAGVTTILIFLTLQSHAKFAMVKEV